MGSSKLTYASAIDELESIVREIESGEIDVDILTSKVKRASELIRYCRDSLRHTQEEADKTLSDLEVGSVDADPDAEE